MSLPGSFVVAIPARHGSTRLPGKPLLPLNGEPMILHVARRALEAGASEVVVATDDPRIAAALDGQPLTVCLTRVDHASGSDRLAECAERLGWDDETVVVNLQGDEPMAPPAGIRAVAQALEESAAPMATLTAPLREAAELFDPNCVKVVADLQGYALYFSRAPLPWARDDFAIARDALPSSVAFRRHIGIYAYRAGFLRRFATLTRTPLEQAEALEQLRALEHGYRIAVRETPAPFPAGVDTPADLARVDALLRGAAA
jgi:3-deoxy-manno-octulosonate cytidylyltransferase (CMP-KDO synthetase)